PGRRPGPAATPSVGRSPGRPPVRVPSAAVRDVSWRGPNFRANTEGTMAMRYYAPLPGGGDPFWPRGPHVMRIGDAERDAAAADLGEHFTAGRLTLEELHERLEAVFAAKTFGQLARIMSDLPGPGRLPGLARLSRHPATPGMPSRPWMPAPAPGYSWADDWNAGMRGSAMGSARAGFQPGWQEGAGGRGGDRDAQERPS